MRAGPRLCSLLQVESVERLTSTVFRKLLLLASATLMECAASRTDSESFALRTTSGTRAQVSTSGTFIIFVIVAVLLVLTIGCACGWLAAAVLAPKHSVEAVPRSPPPPDTTVLVADMQEVRCRHTITNRSTNGTNQWQHRETCLSCGMTVRQEDTRANIERKARLAAKARARPRSEVQRAVLDPSVSLTASVAADS